MKHLPRMTARMRLMPLAICAAISAGVTYYSFAPAFEKQKAERQAFEPPLPFPPLPHTPLPNQSLTLPHRQKQKRKDLWNTRYQVPEDSASGNAEATSMGDIVSQTEERVANAGGATRIPKEAPRWAEAQRGQFARHEGTFEWKDVPLPRYSGDEGGKKGGGKNG